MCGIYYFSGLFLYVVIFTIGPFHGTGRKCHILSGYDWLCHAPPYLLTTISTGLPCTYPVSWVTVTWVNRRHWCYSPLWYGPIIKFLALLCIYFCFVTNRLKNYLIDRYECIGHLLLHFWEWSPKKFCKNKKGSVRPLLNLNICKIQNHKNVQDFVFKR